MFTRFANQRKIFLLLPLIFLFSVTALAQGPGTAFTFQGKLGDSGSPVNGAFDMQFTLFNGLDSSSLQFGTPITLNNPPVQVTNGVFTVQLDFGPDALLLLPGADRYLRIGIRRNSTDPYTVLSPFSKITSAPYAVLSLKATSADTLSPSCNGCISNSQIGSVDANKLAGMLPVNSIPPGSGNYIDNLDNTSFPQLANFNIFGTGTAAIFDAYNEFRIGGARVLAVSGVGFPLSNTFAGADAGTQVSPQFGLNGNENSFFGHGAGSDAHFGYDNSAFGFGAGGSIKDYFQNSFFGSGAGQSVNGNQNTFVGMNADVGGINVETDTDTLLGFHTRVTTGVNNSTAIGARAQVTQSNSLVLGSIAGKNGATADTNVGIGTTGPAFRLHVVDPSNAGLRVQTNITGGTVASFGGNGAFQIDAPGIVGGRFVVTEAGNIGIGTASPTDKLYVNGTVRVETLGAAGTQSLCRNSSHQISTCSSSIRYKTNLNHFNLGLNLVRNLRPVSFNWKQDGMPDFGLVAEEVAKVEPLLVTHNDKGKVEGVKYDRVGVVLINAVKEQQTQIESQQKQIEEQKQIIQQQRAALSQQAKQIRSQSATSSRQQAELDALKKLVCARNRKAQLCRAQN